MRFSLRYVINRVGAMSSDSKVIASNVVWAFVIKGLSLIVSFFSVPAFIAYFDDNVYLGVWYTILSVLMWFLTFDFGLGNGIRNNLVKAFSQKDWESAQCFISSGLFAILLVSIGMLAVGGVLLYCIDLNSLFNVSVGQIPTRYLVTSVAIVFISILLKFVLVSVSSVFYALQRSSVNNFLALISSVLVLAYVLVLRFDTPGESLVWLSVAYLVSYSLPPVVAAAIVFKKDLHNCIPTIGCIKKRYINQIMRIGGIFFYCQILYTLITCTDQFLITRLYGSACTVDYTFYYRLTSLVGIIVSLAVTPVWSMVTKACEEKKYVWLGHLYVRMKKIGYGLLVLEFLFVPFMQPVMNIWLGDASIEVDYLTAISFAVFNACFIMASIASTIVCGLARMKLQAIFYTVGTILKFVVVLALYKYVGAWELVVWADILVFFPYVIAQDIDLTRLFKRLSTTPSL